MRTFLEKLFLIHVGWGLCVIGNFVVSACTFSVRAILLFWGLGNFGNFV